MSEMLCAGCLLKCSCGTTPAPLTVLPVNRVNARKCPAGNILDNKPFVNITPFTLCNNPLNPAVAAARAAAGGAPVPGPCLPNTPAPWITSVPTVRVGSVPHINFSSRLLCVYGGVIEAVVPAQFTVRTPS